MVQQEDMKWDIKGKYKTNNSKSLKKGFSSKFLLQRKKKQINQNLPLHDVFEEHNSLNV
jgi:hypothetical protein